MTEAAEKNCLSCRHEPRWKSRWGGEPGREGVCGRSGAGAPMIRIINIGRDCRQPYDIWRDNYPFIFNCPMWEAKMHVEARLHFAAEGLETCWSGPICYGPPGPRKGPGGAENQS